jgi:hypothetical protein
MCSRKISSYDEAYPYFKPYKDIINRRIKEAVNSYREIPPLQRLMDSPRTRSSSISDRILWNISHCTELLEDKTNIKIRRRYGTLRVLIRDRVQLVFKKLNSNMMPARPSSPRSLNYLNQCDDINKEFPGIENIERVTNLYWGYIWTILGDPRTPIVCLDGSQLMWYFEDVGTMATAEKETEKQNEMGSTDETKRKNIRPKDSRNKKKKRRGDINGEGLSENQP